jgi:hypothetical protein
MSANILIKEETTMNRTDRMPTYLLIFYLACVLGHTAQSPKVSDLGYLVRDNEFLVDTNVIYTHARSDQSWPSIACDGTNYLAVWQDSRCFPQKDVFCARIDSQGIILDPAGIHVATVTYDHLQTYCNGTPAIAFNGSEYLIVYQDRRNSAETDIYGARVNVSGTVLDPGGIPISTAPGYQRHPCVASNGNDFLVVWQDERSGSTDIYGSRLDQNGLVQDPGGIEICNAINSQTFPSVASDGTNYFAVWQDARDTTTNRFDIYGARIDTSGILLDTNGIAVFADTATQIGPSISFNTTDYLIVWEDHRTDALGIVGARVDTAGTVLDPSGITISGISSLPEWHPSVTFNNEHYFVVWGDDRNGTYPDIYGARVDTSGTVLDTVNIPISVTPGVKGRPAITSNGDGCFSVWEDDRDYPAGDVYGARIDAAGIVLDPQGIDVTTATAFHDNPGVACSSENSLIAWGDYRNGLYSSDIYGARVDTTGNILDSPSFMLCTAQFGQYSPSIAFNSTDYCVVWTHNIGGAWATKGTRVSTSGIVLDPSFISISSGGNAMSPHIASNNAGFLAVWVDYRNSYTSPDIYGARIGAAGNVLDPSGIAISTLGTLEYMPSVGYGSPYYLVAWEDLRNGLLDIYCTRIDPSGTVIDPSGIAVTTADSLQSNSAIAFDGSNYLVVWQDKRNGSYDIYGSRVAQNGVVLDPGGIAVSTAPNDQIYPSVAFNGSNYVVVWEDYTSYPSDIHGAVVNTSGVVIDTFVATAQPGPQRYPTISSGANPRMIMTYCGWTDSINSHPANAMRTWAVFYTSTGIVEETEIKTNAVHLNLRVSPNPFTHTTNIRFMIHDPRSETVANQTIGESEGRISEHQKPELKIFDAVGRLVKNLLLPTTYYLLPTAVSWDGTDQSNRQLGSGVYFVQLTSRDYSTTEKVLLVR